MTWQGPQPGSAEPGHNPKAQTSERPLSPSGRNGLGGRGGSQDLSSCSSLYGPQDTLQVSGPLALSTKWRQCRPSQGSQDSNVRSPSRECPSFVPVSPRGSGHLSNCNRTGLNERTASPGSQKSGVCPVKATGTPWYGLHGADLRVTEPGGSAPRPAQPELDSV